MDLTTGPVMVLELRVCIFVWFRFRGLSQLPFQAKPLEAKGEATSDFKINCPFSIEKTLQRLKLVMPV